MAGDTEYHLGNIARFLLPSLKLKHAGQGSPTIEQDIHDFLMSHFRGYTASSGNLFGYWRDAHGQESYGEHREFTVALTDAAGAERLKHYLAFLVPQLQEECIYFEFRGSASLIYASAEQDSRGTAAFQA